MKDFYREHEPYTQDGEEYRKLKRDKVLEVIRPICDALGITDYDYVCNKHYERLVVEGQSIGCAGNSICATVMELINYIWVETYAYNRCLGAFEKQTLNYIKRLWIEESNNA